MTKQEIVRRIAQAGEASPTVGGFGEAREMIAEIAAILAEQQAQIDALKTRPPVIERHHHYHDSNRGLP